MKNCCIVRQGFSNDVRVRKEALALVDNGYEVDLICLSRENENKYEKRNGINVHRISMGRSRGGVASYFFQYVTFFCIASFKLWRLYLKKKYDFIQVNTLPDFIVFTTIMPKMFGAKAVIDFHEPAPELFETIFGRDHKFIISVVKFFEKISLLYADHAITVSEPMKIKYIKIGANESKVSVVLNVPNLEFNPELYQKEYDNKEKDRFMIVCHGALLKRYGLDVLIKAIGIAKDTIPNIELNIMGSGEYEGRLKQLAKRLELDEYIHFLGYIPFIEMIKMIAMSDIGVVPIQRNCYSDLVHTNKMFEYIAMKKPVIISRTNAVEEFFGCGNTCLKYFDSGNEIDLAHCIIELYKDEEKRKKMVEHAFDRFKSHRWETAKKDYCRIFERLRYKVKDYYRYKPSTYSGRPG